MLAVSSEYLRRTRRSRKETQMKTFIVTLVLLASLPASAQTTYQSFRNGNTVQTYGSDGSSATTTYNGNSAMTDGTDGNGGSFSSNTFRNGNMT